MKPGIYIHVPFCRKKCDYCSFYSIPLDIDTEQGQAMADVYVSRIIEEAEKRVPEFNQVQIDTVFFGGGTPSILNASHVESIITTLRTLVDVAHNCEVTIEVNPEDAVRSKLASFVNAGITRTVLGVQTLDRILHDAIGRSTSLCDERTLEEYFSIDGVEHCIDIITGVPGQTEETLVHELDRLCSYKPVHISAYLLTVEENTPLSSRMDYHSLEDMQRVLFETTMNFLKHRGYRHYEISNFALPGYESRHNMKYWKFQDYLGLGPGAHSFYGNERFINNMSVQEYINGSGRGPDIDKRKGNAAVIEYVLTGLRLLEGISFNEMEAQLGIKIPDSIYANALKLKQRGLLEIQGDNGNLSLALSGSGLFLADRVIYGLVEDLM